MLTFSEFFVAGLATADAQNASAKVHFMNGVHAFQDQRYGEAAAEFSEAYRESPAFQTLYNIGQVNVMLGHPAEAIEAYEKYLEQGGSAIAASRREEVRAEIDRQSELVGTVSVVVKPAASEIRVDGLRVERSRLAHPLLLVVGKHVVEGVLQGYASAIREIDLERRAHVDLTLELSPIAVPVAPVVRSEAPAPAPASSAQTFAPPTQRVGSGSGQRTWGYVVGGVGAAAVGVGIALSMIAVGHADDSKSLLAQAKTGAEYDRLYPDAASKFASAKDLDRAGLATIGIGGAAVVAAIALVITAPTGGSSERSGLAPWIPCGGGRSALGAVARGTW